MLLVPSFRVTTEYEACQAAELMEEKLSLRPLLLSPCMQGVRKGAVAPDVPF